MKSITPNIIMLILGFIILLLEAHFMLDGTIGWLFTTTGVILLGIGIFKGNNPIKTIFNFVLELL